MQNAKKNWPKNFNSDGDGLIKKKKPSFRTRCKMSQP